MEAAPVHIIQYFDGSKQGIIPLFQRPYSWEGREWATLWDDLMAQHEAEEKSSHFMGAVVTVPVKSVPVGVTKHFVIDGQQRLTTLALLLIALQDKAQSESDSPTAGIIGDFLVNRHYSAPDDLKLLPTQVDRAAYNALVYQKDLSEYEEARVVQAFKYFKRRLDGKDSNDQAISAASILRTIQQCLQVVMINLGEADDPYLIFESLNHKGKALNQADLVRNYVLMRFQHSSSEAGEQKAVYEDLWRPMEVKLQASMTDFLRHYSMRRGKGVLKGEIYTASKQEFENIEGTEDVKKSLADMKSAAMAYNRFLHPEEEPREQIAKSFQAIQELDSTIFYPLLLRLYSIYECGTISSDEFLHCLNVLESFYVRRQLCGVPTNNLNKIVLEICSNLPNLRPDAWLVEKLRNGAGSRRCPSDQEFKESLVSRQIYRSPKLARYILVALEEAHKHKETVDTATATMEHIMPQTLNDAWKCSLGDSWDRIHSQWIDTLGNLTLTGYNAELGNSAFDEKKRKLQNTHFELSRGLLTEEVWGPQQIEDRSERLAELALKRWAMD